VRLLSKFRLIPGSDHLQPCDRLHPKPRTLSFSGYQDTRHSEKLIFSI
jgi:hypothetical protein